MAKRKSQPNGIINTNIVWDAASDTYNHVDIKTWLDDFDAAVGALMADRTPLGTVHPWSFPDKVSPDSTTPAVPDGWAVCNGQTLNSSQHDFPEFAGVSVVLPDYRNKTLIGADPGNALRAAGTATVSPGIKGKQGANTSTVPDHYHLHQHAHVVGNVAGVETLHAVEADGSSGGLNDPIFNNPVTVNIGATGSGYDITRQGHAHQLAALYTGQPRDPAQNNLRVVDAASPNGSLLNRFMTTLQILWDGSNAVTGAGNTGSPTITPGGGTVPSGATTRDSLVVSAQQASEGVYYIMKVTWGTNYTRPWPIRNATGSTDTVGSA